MKLKQVAIYFTILLLGVTSALGQNERTTVVNGQILRSPTFNPTDIISLSQFNGGYGTAKYMAMGGAFTSLGADLSSAHVNPAGLGLYRSSEFNITPSINISEISNKNGVSGDNSKTRLGFNNIGMAMNLYQGSGTLTSFTMAITYNKLADFNYRSSVGVDGTGTIADAFVRQLYGVNSDALLGDTPWYGDRDYSPIDLSLWPAVMGFKTFLVDNPHGGGKHLYETPGIAPNTEIMNDLHLSSKGRAGEIAIATGFNLKNKLYLGLTIGIVDFYNDQELLYEETYSNNAAIEPHNFFSSTFSRRFSGTGVNVKLGAIYNPVGGLRLGVAVHTPTFADIKMRYSIDAIAFGKIYDPETDQLKLEKEEAYSPVNRFDNKFNTPTRLMFGVSYTFGNRALISMDYERTWYDGLKYKSGTYADKNWYKDEFKSIMQGSNTFRMGGEFRPTNNVYLRAGFMYNGDMTNSNLDVNLDRLDAPIIYKLYNISAGVGFQLGRHTMLDLTYTYMNSKQTTYDFYHYETNSDPYEEEIGNVGVPYFSTAGGITPTIKRHVITMSLGWRF